jgi:hypothetical protein
MAIRAIEGFETRQSATYTQRLYTGGGNQTTMAVAGGRRAGSSLNAVNFSVISRQLVASAENTWVICFAMRVDDGTVAVPGGSTGGVQLYDESGEQIALVLQPGAVLGTWKLEMRRGATVLASTSDLNTGGQLSWQYFQWKVTVRTGTDGVAELRRWGYHDTSHTVEFSVSSINTANQAVDGATRFGARCNAGGSRFMRLDDIVVMDDTGGVNDDFTASPYVVLGTLPAGAGNYSDWTPSAGAVHWSLVDDPAGTPADTEFVSADTVGQQDSFDYAARPLLLGAATAIAGVQVTTSGKMLNSGEQDVSVLVRSGGSDDNGAGETFDDLASKSFPTVFDVNPIGPAAWTKASVEAAEFGVEVDA